MNKVPLHESMQIHKPVEPEFVMNSLILFILSSFLTPMSVISVVRIAARAIQSDGIQQFSGLLLVVRLFINPSILSEILLDRDINIPAYLWILLLMLSVAGKICRIEIMQSDHSSD